MEQKKREVIAKKKFDNAEARIEDDASREVKINLLIKFTSFVILYLFISSLDFTLQLRERAFMQIFTKNVPKGTNFLGFLQF